MRGHDASEVWTDTRYTCFSTRSCIGRIIEHNQGEPSSRAGIDLFGAGVDSSRAVAPSWRGGVDPRRAGVPSSRAGVDSRRAVAPSRRAGVPAREIQAVINGAAGEINEICVRINKIRVQINGAARAARDKWGAAPGAAQVRLGSHTLSHCFYWPAR